MDEDWDNDTSAAPKTDANNNIETKSSGFGGGFGAKTESSGFGSSRGRGVKGGFGSNGFGHKDGDEQEKTGFGTNGFGSRGDRSSGFGEARKGFGARNEDGETKSGFGGGGGFGGGASGGDKTCFNCKKSGHMSRECPEEKRERTGGFGGGDKTCFNCKQSGHMSRECPEEKKERTGGFGARNGFGESRGGFGARNEDGEKKNGFGGFGQKDDTDGAPKTGFGGFSGFGSKTDGENSGEKTCFNCKKPGHMSRECTEEKRERGSSDDKTCFNCKKSGHMSRECTEERVERKGGKEGADGEEIKRERYIPEEDEDNETNLFHNFSVGVNFEKQAEIAVSLTGEGSEEITPLKSFEDAKLTELLMSNVSKSNYKIPTPVQKYAIPTILKKRDLMACAQTGSGKTAAYVLPIMTNILHDGIQSSSFSTIQEPQALILSPTRELATQIFNECRKFSYGSIIKSGILYGGVDTGFQISNLGRGCNILVATPGRLLDVLEKGKISLAKVKYFVLDEADRMLDMGFEKSVRDILTKGSILAKGDRVTLMFSATFPKEIQKLAQDFLNNYLFLAVGIVGGANSDVQQSFYKCTKFEKRDKVVEILNEIGQEKVMIFIEHKKQADVMGFYLLQKGYPTTTLHGDRLQSQRELALKDFKSGKSNIIVCTSVAARGLDIEKVNHVINVDLPQSVDEYVHRIGRTGRCGNIGKAISFFDPGSENDVKLARPLARILVESSQPVPDWLSALAEDSVGTTFASSECTDDLRFGIEKISIKAPKVAEEEEW